MRNVWVAWSRVFGLDDSHSLVKHVGHIIVVDSGIIEKLLPVLHPAPSACFVLLRVTRTLFHIWFGSGYVTAFGIGISTDLFGGILEKGVLSLMFGDCLVFDEV